MKQFTTFGFLLALAFSLYGYSSRAHADDPKDCTKGCTIVTCSGSVCMVWYCDSAGCRIIGDYRRPPVKEQSIGEQGIGALSDRPAAFDRVCDASRPNTCAIKTCSGAMCSILAFDGKDFVPIGQVENVDYLLKQAAPQLKH